MHAVAPAPPPGNLRSTHHLNMDKAAFVRGWLGRQHPLYVFAHLVMNRRAVRLKEFCESVCALELLAPALPRVDALCEVAAGHGMVGVFAALTHPHLTRVTLVDKRQPDSYERIVELVAPRWPFLKRRLRYLERRAEHAPPVTPRTLVAAIHGCGALTDHTAALAHRSGAPFFVVPCCESRALLGADAQRLDLSGEAMVAEITRRRLDRWRAWGYALTEVQLPEGITDRPRGFFAWPTPTAPEAPHG